MTELESLRAERSRKREEIRHAEDRLHRFTVEAATMDARIAELEREPQRWRPSDDGERWRVCMDGRSIQGASYLDSAYPFNAFPTEARAQEVATHFKRLGLAAQWGALLTDEAWNAGRNSDDGFWWAVPYGKPWAYAFPTAAQRDGFMADAKREGLL